MTGFKSLFPFIIIVAFLGLQSCSQHVKITPRKCLAPKARWSLPTDTDRFRFKRYIRTDGEFTSVRRIVAEKKRSCGDIDHISLTHKYTWGDVLWNMLPFTGRSTLFVSGSSSTTTPKK